MKPTLSCLMGLVLLLFSSTFTEAALWDRGGGLIYDDRFDITWLQNANLAMTSGYDADGLMTAPQAMAWTDSLVYQGYTDWRLPDALNLNGSVPDYGWNQNANEMGYMYYTTLGNQATLNVSDLGGLTTVGPFANLHPFRYWSGTPYYLSSEFQWYFNFGSGLQWDAVGDNQGYVWAVRDGDSTPVPLPGSLPLLLSVLTPGLAALKLRGFRGTTVF